MDTYYKQPTERLDYDVDFSEWLPAGDAIITTAVVSAPVGLTILITDGATLIPKLWVEGGVDAITYIIEVTCETQYGRTKEVNFKLKVKDT
jgi:hypothetical protein